MEWANDIIFPHVILPDTSSFTFILCALVVLGFCSLSSLFFGYFSLLANFFTLSMALGIPLCRGKWHVSYIIAQYLAYQPYGICALPSSLLSPFLLFGLLCMTLVSESSICYHDPICHQSHFYQHWSPCSVGQVSCLLTYHYGMCSLVCMTYMGWMPYYAYSAPCLWICLLDVQYLSQFALWGTVLLLLASSRCALCCVISLPVFINLTLYGHHCDLPCYPW